MVDIFINTPMELKVLISFGVVMIIKELLINKKGGNNGWKYEINYICNNYCNIRKWIS